MVSSWLGKRDLVRLCQRHDLAHVGRGILLLVLEALGEQLVELGVGLAAALAAVIVAQLDLVAELALAGVWSISDISLTSGRSISSLASSTTLGIGISQRRCRK